MRVSLTELRPITAWRSRQGRRRADEQAPTVALVLAAHLRAGRSLLQALEDAGDDLPDPVRTVVQRAAAAAVLGASPALAMDGADWEGELRLLATAVSVQARYGGDLPVLLEDLAEAMHDRAAVARAARVATAQARATGRIVSGMPLAGLAALLLVDRPAATGLVAGWFGWLVLGLAAGLTAAGQLAIVRLTRVDP